MPSRPSLQRRRGGRGSKPQPSGAVLRHTRRDLRRFSWLCSCEVHLWTRYSLCKLQDLLSRRLISHWRSDLPRTPRVETSNRCFFSRATPGGSEGFESPSAAATEPSRGVGRDAMLSERSSTAFLAHDQSAHFHDTCFCLVPTPRR